MWEDTQWSGEENWSGAGNDASWWGQGAEYGGSGYSDYRNSDHFWNTYPDGYPHPFAQGEERKIREKHQKFA
jgi:hypothetical protein